MMKQVLFLMERSLSSQIKNGAVEEGYNRKESEKYCLNLKMFCSKTNNYK